MIEDLKKWIEQTEADLNDYAELLEALRDAKNKVQFGICVVHLTEKEILRRRDLRHRRGKID